MSAENMKKTHTPDVEKQDNLNRYRETERRARADFERFKEKYPDLKYEDVFIVGKTALKLNDGRILRLSP